MRKMVFAHLPHRLMMRMNHCGGHGSTLRTLKHKTSKKNFNRLLCFLGSLHPTEEETDSNPAVMREAKSILTLDSF